MFEILDHGFYLLKWNNYSKFDLCNEFGIMTMKICEKKTFLTCINVLYVMSQVYHNGGTDEIIATFQILGEQIYTQHTHGIL